MQAAHDGIKEGNPQAVVISPDPSGIGKGGGTTWMDTYLKAGGLSSFDIVAIHPYRRLPETPDLDLDTSGFIDMLTRHGYTGDIWYTEGFQFPKHIIPPFSFDTFAMFKGRGLGVANFSYDLGFGEKISAAFYAREWLITLKYATRVKMNLAFYPGFRMDFNMTPRAHSWVPNTLGHILGNADYVQDIVVNDDTRCYAFEDEKKRPVAVFWNTSESIDRGIREGSVLTLPFSRDEVEIIDLMGKVTDCGDGQLQITSFPVFVRGQSGTTASFCKKLSKDLEGVGVTRVKPSVRVVAKNRIEVTLQNVLSTEVKGRVSIDCMGKTVTRSNLSLKGRKTRIFSVPIFRRGDIFEKIALKISFLPHGQTKTQVTDVSFVLITAKKRKGDIVIDGDISDWRKDFAIALPDTFIDFPIPKEFLTKFSAPIPWKGKRDLSAILYSCWDEKNLYIAVKVRDDVFSVKPEDDVSFYKYDTLQVYLDPLCDARDKGKFRGYDSNDYCYNLWKVKDGLELVRGKAPDWQVAFLRTGPVPEIKRAFRGVGDGMIYEVAFPAKHVFPLTLKKGNSFGFAIIVNDNDKDYRKRGLTLTPAGTEPCAHPHLYPVMLLDE